MAEVACLCCCCLCWDVLGWAGLGCTCCPQRERKQKQKADEQAKKAAEGAKKKVAAEAAKAGFGNANQLHKAQHVFKVGATWCLQGRTTECLCVLERLCHLWDTLYAILLEDCAGRLCVSNGTLIEYATESAAAGPTIKARCHSCWLPTARVAASPVSHEVGFKPLFS